MLEARIRRSDPVPSWRPRSGLGGGANTWPTQVSQFYQQRLCQVVGEDERHWLGCARGPKLVRKPT